MSNLYSTRPTTAKEQYEGKTRTNLTALLTGVIKLQFDNRTATIDEHINEFQIGWGRLASTVAGATDITQAAGAYAVLTKCDSAKAQILLGTLPDYYKMVVNNIASQSENSTYQSVTVQLRDLITKSGKGTKAQETITPPTTFARQSSGAEQTCDYCRKTKGWSGCGHLEADCRTKKEDVEFKQYHQAHLANADEEEECQERAYTASTDTKQQASSRCAWQYDSACSTHLTPHLDLLQNATPYRTQVRDISRGSEWSTHKGSITINQAGRKSPSTMFYAPKALENLLSGQVLLRKKVYPAIVHDGNPRLIHDGKTVLVMTFDNNKQRIYGTKGERVLAGASNSVGVWHQRYGHLSLPAVKNVSEAPSALNGARLHQGSQ